MYSIGQQKIKICRVTNTMLNEQTNYDVKKLRRLNILLAEDNLLNAKLISILFARHDIKLQVAKNGLEAIEKIKAYRARLACEGRMLEARAVEQCLRYLALDVQKEVQTLDLIKQVETMLQTRNKV